MNYETEIWILICILIFNLYFAISYHNDQGPWPEYPTGTPGPPLPGMSDEESLQTVIWGKLFLEISRITQA